MPHTPDVAEEAPKAPKAKPKAAGRAVFPHLYVWDPNLKHKEGRLKTANSRDRNYDPDDVPHWFRRATPEEVRAGHEVLSLRSTPAGQLTDSQLQKLLEYRKLEDQVNQEAQDDDVDP